MQGRRLHCRGLAGSVLEQRHIAERTLRGFVFAAVNFKTQLNRAAIDIAQDAAHTAIQPVLQVIPRETVPHSNDEVGSGLRASGHFA